MPISTSSSENALSSRIAVATEDSRSRRPRPLVLPAAFFLAIRFSPSARQRREPELVPLCGPLFRGI